VRREGFPPLTSTKHFPLRAVEVEPIKKISLPKPYPSSRKLILGRRNCLSEARSFFDFFFSFPLDRGHSFTFYGHPPAPSVTLSLSLSLKDCPSAESFARSPRRQETPRNLMLPLSSAAFVFPSLSTAVKVPCFFLRSCSPFFRGHFNSFDFWNQRIPFIREVFVASSGPWERAAHMYFFLPHARFLPAVPVPLLFPFFFFLCFFHGTLEEITPFRVGLSGGSISFFLDSSGRSFFFILKSSARRRFIDLPS